MNINQIIPPSVPIQRKPYADEAGLEEENRCFILGGGFATEDFSNLIVEYE